MAKNNRNSVFNIAFVVILVFSLVVSFNSTVIARPSSNRAPEILDTTTPTSDAPVSSATVTLAAEPSIPAPTKEPASTDTISQSISVNIIPEQPQVLSGWFSVIWGESKNPSNGSPVTRYILTDDSGKSTNLILGDVVSGLEGDVISLDNKYVSVEGTWLDLSSTGQNSVLNVTSISLASSKGLSESSEGAVVSGTIPFISIMCKFNDVAVEPKGLGYFQGLYSTSGPQLGDYWDQVSYGQISMAGSNAVGWFTLPQNKSYYVYDMNSDGYVDLDFDRAANDCIATADPTVDFSAYSNGGINLMFNDELDGFAWNGCRPMSLDGIDQCWPMTWEPPWAYSNITVMAYQLGHLLGMPNSSGHGIEYDNVWDLMGDNWASCEYTTNPIYGCLAQHPNAFNKSVMGWIPSDQIFNLPYNTEATINLEQLALPATSNYLLAEIPIQGSSTHYYTVEVRNLTGFDAKLPGKAVIIHEVNTERTIPADVIDLDSTDFTGDAGAMWLVGEKFVDSANKVTIDVLSATTTGFQVKVRSGTVPVGYGTYDDRAPEVEYQGSWLSHEMIGNYLNTEKYSYAKGSSAGLTFTGEQVTVIYRGYSNLMGVMGVKIDGVDVGTINQTTPGQSYQLHWSSDNLGAGTHTILLTHSSGTYTTLDGFIVSGPPAPTPTPTITSTPTETPTLPSTITPTPSRTPTVTLTPLGPLGYGTYDERTSQVVYSGSWLAHDIFGNYLNTEKYSYVKGSSARFTFTGEEVTIIYRGYSNLMGVMGVKIDGVDVGTINQTTPGQSYQLHWNSGNLGTGDHTIVLTHLSGTYVTLDGIIVSGPPVPTSPPASTFTPTETLATTSTSTPNVISTPTVTLTPLGAVGYGTYDDRNTQIVYTGSWLEHPIVGNYLNTEKYSNALGSSARFTFTGEEISLIYRGYSRLMGVMGINIDGVDVGTINQTAPSQAYQLRWRSGDLGAGDHTIVLTHLSGTYTTLDAFIVSGAPNVTPTAGSTNVPTVVPTAGPTATPKPIYPYNLVHSGNFGRQTIANCHAVGYAKKVSGSTGKIYIRIYIDDVLVGGQYTLKGGSFDFDLTTLPGFTFTTGIEHEIRLMAILENTLPYDLINPVTHQPGGLLTCH